MSRNNRRFPKLDLRLNLSPPTRGDSTRRMFYGDDSSPTGSFSSSPSSCLSSENEHGLRCSNSPEATSMVLAGCPRCLMYVMLPEEDPRCPKCKSTVLLDFLHNNYNNNNGSKKNRKS